VPIWYNTNLKINGKSIENTQGIENFIEVLIKMTLNTTYPLSLHMCHVVK